MNLTLLSDDSHSGTMCVAYQHRENDPKVAESVLVGEYHHPTLGTGWVEVSRFPAECPGLEAYVIVADEVTVIHIVQLDAEVPVEALQVKPKKFVNYVVCDRCNTKKLLAALPKWNPRAVIPVNAERDVELVEEVSKQWPTLFVPEGETFSPMGSYFETGATATMYVSTEPMNAPQRLDLWWRTETKILGEFANTTDAKHAVQWTLFDPMRVIGYIVYEEEDMAPRTVTSYTAEGALLTEFEVNERFPKELTPCRPVPFTPGMHVWVLLNLAEVIIRCEVVGEPTLAMKKKHVKERFKRPFNECLDSIDDWDWDLVAVRQSISSDIFLVERAYVFPYQRLDDLRPLCQEPDQVYLLTD